ncbi:MAG: YARHG domain-containing protein [Romboutsia sp.]
MKTCHHCGKKIEKNKSFCTHCGLEQSKCDDPTSKNIGSKRKFNKFPIALVIISILIITCLLGKNSIMYNYYIYKADNEKIIAQSIGYYKKALNLEYNEDIVNKIRDKVKSSNDTESIMTGLKNIVNRNDLQKMYIDVYVYKAKENFNKKNYETVWNYLDKAESIGYDVEKFEYYGDLNKIKKSEDNINIAPIDSSYYQNIRSEFIIPDSNVRYLTKEELSPYSKNDLAIIRNEIFARYGYIFKTKEYRDFFNTTTWYKPNPNCKGDESELNPIEKANIKLIKTIEKQ